MVLREGDEVGESVFFFFFLHTLFYAPTCFVLFFFPQLGSGSLRYSLGLPYLSISCLPKYVPLCEKLRLTSNILIDIYGILNFIFFFLAVKSLLFLLSLIFYKVQWYLNFSFLLWLKDVIYFFLFHGIDGEHLIMTNVV